METMKGRREIGSVISSTYGGNTDSAKVDTKSGSLRSVKFVIGNKLVLFSAELQPCSSPVVSLMGPRMSVENWRKVCL